MKYLFLLLGDYEYFENMSHKCSNLKACHWLAGGPCNADTWGRQKNDSWEELCKYITRLMFHWRGKLFQGWVTTITYPVRRKINLPASTFRHLKNSYGNTAEKKIQGCLTLKYLFHGLISSSTCPRNICAFLHTFCSYVLMHFRVQTCLFREIILNNVKEAFKIFLCLLISSVLSYTFLLWPPSLQIQQPQNVVSVSAVLTTFYLTLSA